METLPPYQESSKAINNKLSDVSSRAQSRAFTPVYVDVCRYGKCFYVGCGVAETQTVTAASQGKLAALCLESDELMHEESIMHLARQLLLQITLQWRTNSILSRYLDVYTALFYTHGRVNMMAAFQHTFSAIFAAHRSGGLGGKGHWALRTHLQPASAEWGTSQRSASDLCRITFLLLWLLL